MSHNPREQRARLTPICARMSRIYGSDFLRLRACASDRPSWEAPRHGAWLQVHRQAGAQVGCSGGRVHRWDGVHRWQNSRPSASPAPSRTPDLPGFRPPSSASPPCPLFLSLPPKRLSPPSQTPPCGSHYTSPRMLGEPGTQLSRHQRHLRRRQSGALTC